MSDEQCKARAIALMKDGFAEVASHGLTPRYEAQVHEAVDLLRMSRADQTLLGTAETISCYLMEMSHYRRQGRVNAYTSKLMRVRKACEGLN